MAGGRTLHVRCTTWEQVEVFCTRKLRQGRLLSMKVPFPAVIGAQVTLGLELPSGSVIAIAGQVLKATPMEAEAGRTWIEIELTGLTEEVLARIRAMIAGAELPEEPTPPIVVEAPGVPRPSGDELPSDERALFNHLTGELRRLRQLAVHEVLGVERDADADEIRLGWMRLVRRHHPDLVARHHAPAITHLAEELTILCNRAYDRLRAALVLEGRATAVGPALRPPAGWLVGFDDISSRDAAGPRAGRAPTSGRGWEPEAEPEPPAVVTAPPPAVGRAPSPRSVGTSPPPVSSLVQGGEAFESRARAMLSNGEADNAQEVLAAALCVYPRSRPLRSLYYVASALAALTKGELMLATSQLETALAHHEQCVEAAQILEHLRRHGASNHEELRRFFR